jgi:holo-[acyl-carrier protein] synthase
LLTEKIAIYNLPRYTTYLPMIYGIGVDIVKVSRVRDAIDRWGESFVNRVFTEYEKKYCKRRMDSAGRYALRFAAKEAMSKALGTGMRRGIHCRQIEVANDPLGKPYLRLYDDAESVCREIGIERCFLSLSDDTGYAVAMVVLEI